jgi:hypothetical protein
MYGVCNSRYTRYTEGSSRTHHELITNCMHLSHGGGAEDGALRSALARSLHLSLHGCKLGHLHRYGGTVTVRADRRG